MISRFTLTIVFVSILSLIQSQTLNMPNIPADGITYPFVMKYDTTSCSEQGPWDFSNVTTSGTESITIMPISTSPLASNYPSATHVLSEEGNQFFVGFDQNSYSFHGEVSIITSSYANPLIIHPYPFGLGDTHSDSELDIPFTVPGGPPALERNDQISSMALDTGTITMPDGTIHENALLLKVDRTFNDGQVGSPTCNTSVLKYEWWVMGYAVPVATIYTLSQSGACPPGNPVKISKFLVGDPSANIMETAVADVSIYPNPTKGLIHIKSEENLSGLTFTIYDHLGRSAFSGTQYINDNNIDIESLPGGVYTLRISGATPKSFRFLKL